MLLAGDPHTTHIGRARPVEEGCRHVEVKGGGRRQGWVGVGLVLDMCACVGVGGVG